MSLEVLVVLVVYFVNRVGQELIVSSAPLLTYQLFGWSPEQSGYFMVGSCIPCPYILYVPYPSPPILPHIPYLSTYISYLSYLPLPPTPPTHLTRCVYRRRSPAHWCCL